MAAMHCSNSPSYQTFAESLPYAKLCARHWWQRLASKDRLQVGRGSQQEAISSGIAQEGARGPVHKGRWGCIMVLQVGQVTDQVDPWGIGSRVQPLRVEIISKSLATGKHPEPYSGVQSKTFSQ